MELDRIKLTSGQNGVVEVTPFGAHVLSWKDSTGKERLYLSDKAKLDGTAAIRGGIPIIFPQFNDMGSLPKHGFARTEAWRVANVSTSSIRFELSQNSTISNHFSGEFTAKLEVALSNDGDCLELSIDVGMDDESEVPMQIAFHTYFACDDISQVAVCNLGGLNYLDNLDDRKEKAQEDDTVTFAEEVDRIYTQTPRECRILTSRTQGILMQKMNMPDSVVWNPWIDKCASIGDLSNDAYRKFFCVEAGVVSPPVTVTKTARLQCGMCLNRLVEIV